MIKNYFVIIVFVLSSCSIKSDNGADEETINTQYFKVPDNISTHIANKHNHFMFNDFYHKIDGFQLDLKGGPVGGIHKVRLFDSTILILDRYYTKKIFAYNLETGNYLFSIGEEGKGPGEFIRLGDFEIDKKNQIIVTCDWYMQRISFFDLQGGFKYSKEIQFTPIHMGIAGDFYYFLCANPNSQPGFDNLKITTSRLKIVKEYDLNSSLPVISWPNITFSYYNNILLLFYPLSDTVYKLDSTSIDTYAVLNAGNRSFMAALSSNKINIPSNFKERSMFLRSNKVEKFILPNGYYEVDSYRYFLFRLMNKRYCMIQNKKTNKNQIQGIPFFNPHIPSSSDPLYSVQNIGDFFAFSPSSLSKINQNTIENNSIFSRRLTKSIQSLNDSNNPFILIFK